MTDYEFGDVVLVPARERVTVRAQIDGAGCMAEPHVILVLLRGEVDPPIPQ